jgi:hypothetical protein
MKAAWGFISCKDPTFTPHCPTLYHTLDRAGPFSACPFWGRKATIRVRADVRISAINVNPCTASKSIICTHSTRIPSPVLPVPGFALPTYPSARSRATGNQDCHLFILLPHQPVCPSSGQHIRVVDHLRLYASTVLIHQNTLRKSRALVILDKMSLCQNRLQEERYVGDCRPCEHDSATASLTSLLR